MSKTNIFVAGHKGMVGSAIIKLLTKDELLKKRNNRYLNYIV